MIHAERHLIRYPPSAHVADTKQGMYIDHPPSYKSITHGISRFANDQKNFVLYIKFFFLDVPQKPLQKIQKKSLMKYI